MRKITQEITRAFYSGDKKVIRNTETDGQAVYLHGNKIAEKREGVLWVTLAGWNTLTTRERLNGLSGVRVTTKLGQASLNGKEWDGNWTPVVQNREGIKVELRDAMAHLPALNFDHA